MGEAVVFQWAVAFFPAVTVVFRVGCLACSEDFSVVLLNYGLQAVCAAITYFYVVFVEDLVVPVIFRKMFTDEVQKLSADVSLYVHAVRRIKPNYVSLSFLSALHKAILYSQSSFTDETLNGETFEGLKPIINLFASRSLLLTIYIFIKN